MRIVLLAALLLAAIPPVADAHHCSGVTTSTDAVPAGPFYVVAATNPYLYQETNGIPGLQRGDRDRDDTCHGIVLADKRVF